MKTIWKLCILSTVAVPPFLLSSLSGQDIPKTMMKISTRVIEPESEASSFAAQPKTLWRAGTKYVRIAEAPDTQHHIHGLTIINEPDAWMINLDVKSGRHVLDPGPSFDVHVPMFQTSGEAKMKLNELEFGKEMEFFAKNEPKQSAGEVIKGRATDRYEVIVSGSKLGSLGRRAIQKTYSRKSRERHGNSNHRIPCLRGQPGIRSFTVSAACEHRNAKPQMISKSKGPRWFLSRELH